MTALPPTNRPRRFAWLAAILLTAAAAWLHVFFLLHAGGLWRDEVNLLNLAGHNSFADMTRDSFPILMPLLVRGWSAAGLGGNDFGLRFLGMLIGLAIPGALWLAARATRRPPLFSLVLLCLNATVICYGDSLRGYGLGSALIVAVMGAMWAFLKNPTWRRAVILTAAAILSVQALYQNAVLFAAICFGAWAVCWRRKNPAAAGKIFIAAALAAISLLPYWTAISALPKSSTVQRLGFLPARAFANFSSVISFPVAQYLYLWGILALLVVAAGLMVLRTRPAISASAAGEHPADELPLFAGVTMLAALAGFTGFLWYAALPTQPWYFLPLVALLAATFDFGAPVAPASRPLRAVVFGLLAATALLAPPLAQKNLNRRFTDVDLLARQVAAEAAPQDLVIVTPWYCGISFDHYFKSATPWQTLPPLADHTTHRYDLFRQQMQTPHALQPVLDAIGATLQSGHRVWLVGILPPTDSAAPADLPPPPLPGYGWSDLPYSARWAEQAAWFLENHSLRFECVNAATNLNVSADEDLQLFSATGWKK